jgi:hypothetical protein
MSLLGKYLDDFLNTYAATHEAQSEPVDDGRTLDALDHASVLRSSSEHLGEPRTSSGHSMLWASPGPGKRRPSSDHTAGPRARPAPARVCAQCGDMTARVYLVMNGGWMLCSHCYRQ